MLSAWFLLRAPADDRSVLVQWIEGRSYSVQFGGHVDAKMFLYVFGAALPALNAVSSAAYHQGRYGEAANIGLYLHAAMRTWIYFVYLTVFFISRERTDERRCAARYGELWTQYMVRVRYRSIPGVY